MNNLRNERKVISNNMPLGAIGILKKLLTGEIIYDFAKRILDIVGGIVGVALLVPITMVVFIIKIVVNESERPIFYTQERIGKNGKTFKMYKFRTMCKNADEKLDEYLENNPEAKEEYKKYKKLKNDPRVTKVGKILRKTSLDEFPQLINILKGDMSLVGPRPYLPRERKDMNGFFEYIIACKPGLTGFWQVNGRSETTFEDRLKIDMQYYYERGIIADIKVLFKTVKSIIKKVGAV